MPDFVPEDYVPKQEVPATLVDMQPVLQQIDHYCNPEYKPDFITNDFLKANESEDHEAEVVNTVFDNLLQTLRLTATDCNKRYGELYGKQSTEPAFAHHYRKRAEECVEIIKAIEPMAQITRELPNGTLPLRIDRYLEEGQAIDGDKVYGYFANKFKLEDTEYDSVKILIRPEEFIRKLDSTNTNDIGTDVIEYAEARMRIAIVPRNAGVSRIDIRVDLPKNSEDIMFDLIINGSRSDLLEGMSLRSTASNSLESNQDKGHHFKGGIKANEHGVSFKQVLERINKVIRTKVRT